MAILLITVSGTQITKNNQTPITKKERANRSKGKESKKEKEKEKDLAKGAKQKAAEAMAIFQLHTPPTQPTTLKKSNGTAGIILSKSKN